jgi:acyl-CoA dehydrogenase
MTTVTWITGLILVTAIFMALAYRRQPLWLWTATFAATLSVVSVYSWFSPALLIILWLLFAAFLLIFQITPIRRNLLSRPILALFGKIMPEISKTEEEALLAGTSWWEAELFSGRPRWATITSLPLPELSTEEQLFLDGPVEELCTMLDEWQIVRDNYDLPAEVWTFLKEKGFFGMIIPKRYGGLEFSALAHSAVIVKLASKSLTAAVTTMVPNSLGPGQLLLRYGTDQQKEYYLPRLASGTEIPCFALTSSVAGSDAAAMLDKGIVCRQDFDGKKDVLGINLSWEKRYITLAPVATIMGLAFKLYDPESLLGDTEELGITVALVPTDLPGVEVGRRHIPLDQAFQNGPTRGTDVFIPLEYVIGGQDYVGQGWRMLMECLADGRSISLPALAAGMGKLATRSTGAYARIRKQFKVPIGMFEGVQEALARIFGYTYAIEAVRLLTAQAIDQDEKSSVVSAIAKYHCTELMRKVVNDAMDVFGGTAICMGPRNLMGRYYEGIPISITVEGANILTRSLIIFGQGLIRCHPYLLAEMQAIQNNDKRKGLRDFDRAFWGHLGYVVSNMVRAPLLAITDGRLSSGACQGRTRKYGGQIVRMSAALALVADAAILVLGGQLKRQESLTARLGDILSQLYIASAAIKRFQEQGQPEEDTVLLDWVCQDALFKAQSQLAGFLNNFPNKLLAWLLKCFLFPLGIRYLPPNDRLGGKVVNCFLEPTETRERLTGGIFISAEADDGLNRIELAFQRQVAVADIEKKARQGLKNLGIKVANDLEVIEQALAEKILSPDEGQKLREAYEETLKALAVDDFLLRE